MARPLFSVAALLSHPVRVLCLQEQALAAQARQDAVPAILAGTKKADAKASALRREGDSNPRAAFGDYTLSRRAS